jgi:hypothetical protein
MDGRFFRTKLLFLCVVLGITCVAQSGPMSVSGKWQMSWEARMGTEHDILELKQADSKLTGNFQGHLGSPKVSGNVDGNNISLRLEFPGKQPYTLIFTGVIDGDKMNGKFEIEGMPSGYDQHGENARPSNYTWTAVRQPKDS